MVRTSSLLILRIATLPFETLMPLRRPGAVTAAEDVLRRLERQPSEAERLSALLHEAAGETAPPGEEKARGALLRIRRAVHQGRTVTPRLLEEAGDLLDDDLRARIDAHLACLAEAEELRREFLRAFEQEERESRDGTLRAAADPLFRLGLRLAGRSLLRRAEALARADVARWRQREHHTASKLAAYLSRFTTKTSPNGVFCATGVAELSDGPAVVEGGNRIARMDFLVHVGEARKIAACLAASREASRASIPRPNPTLRLDGDHWTYWRPASPRRPTDDEVLCRVKDHPVLRLFLDAASPERSSAEEVLRVVTEQAGRDVGPFYAQLVERGILIGEVEIPWSERRPLAALAARCPDAPWAGTIGAIESGVARLGGSPPEEIVPRLDEIAARLDSLPHARPLSEDDLIRCDSRTDVVVRIPREVLRDLERLVPLYARFYGAVYPEALYRESFATRFLGRYPADTPVPVLDFYHDLFEPKESGRPAAFVSPASGGSDSPLRAAAASAFESARAFFARRARDARETGQTEIQLSESNWTEIAAGAPEPRFSCAALFQIAAPAAGQVTPDGALLCLNAFFPGSGLSVARLAHLHGAGGEDGESLLMRRWRNEWARRAPPGAEHAEVTFMHGGRTANAGLRPPILPIEIELPGDRATPGRDVLPLADLTASYDSRTKRFLLRSRSRGTEILPVISSGINPEGIVSFLTMIGGQDVQPLGLFPGFDVPGIRCWPRFRFGNVVLFRRRWAFDASELPAGGTDGEYFLDTQRWRREHLVPAHVFVHSRREPKPFHVDLESPAFVDLFRRSVGAPRTHGAGRVYVTEMLPGPEDLWVSDARGRYASEFLVHLDNLDPPAGSP